MIQPAIQDESTDLLPPSHYIPVVYVSRDDVLAALQGSNEDTPLASAIDNMPLLDLQNIARRMANNEAFMQAYRDALECEAEEWQSRIA